jgi:hypothetical protein
MERGQPLTKAFGRLRKRLGIDEREPGARQANVDLHVPRRWMIAKCRDAINAGPTGWTLYTVAEIVGHAKGNLGLSMTSQYAGRKSLEAKSKAVEAVRLASHATAQFSSSLLILCRRRQRPTTASTTGHKCAQTLNCLYPAVEQMGILLSWV